MTAKILKQTIFPLITFKPIPVAGVFILLLLIANLSAYAAQLIPATEMAGIHLTFVAVGTLSRYVAFALILLVLYAGGTRFAAWLRDAFEVSDKTEKQPESKTGHPETVLHEAGQIERSLQSITQTLARVEQDRNAATLLISDAQIQSALLISLIKTIAGKAEHYERQNRELAEAQAAITGGDPMTIARTAGAVSDTHIQALMLTDIADPGYWLNVNRTIAAQSGTLAQWSEGYKRFAGRLLLDFSQIKARLTALEAAGELVDVARPLTKLKSNLTAAGEQLQLGSRLGLETTGLLPKLN